MIRSRRSGSPAVPGLAGTPYWTNREAIEAEQAPRSLLVLGGGRVGAELGQVFARFGTEVTVVERSERLLEAEEPESGELLREVFGQEGITVCTGCTAARVAYDGGEFEMSLTSGSSLRGERLLVAVGRGRGAEHAHAGGACPRAGPAAERDDLRLPDLPRDRAGRRLPAALAGQVPLGDAVLRGDPPE